MINLTNADLEAIRLALEWALIEDDGRETEGMPKALAKVLNGLGASPRQTTASATGWASAARAIWIDAALSDQPPSGG